MASVDDIRVTVAWRDHPKRQKLRRRLGAEGVLALMDLWLWAGANRPSGELTGMSDEDVEIAAQWQGDAGAFVGAAVALRLLDRSDAGALRLHDWDDHQIWASGATMRSEAGRKGAQARWNRHVPKGKQTPATNAAAFDLDATASEPQCADSNEAAHADAVALPMHANRSARSGSIRSGSDPPIAPQGGHPPGSPDSPGTEPTAAAPDLGKAKPALKRLVDRHLDAALRVFRALDAARKRINPRTGLDPSYAALRHIAERLEDGKTLEQCLRVVAAYEHDGRRDDEVFRKYVNTETPFRPGNFERALAQGFAPAPEPGAPGAARLGADVLLAPDGLPYPEEIVPDGIERAEAEERVRLMRLTDPELFDKNGNPKRGAIAA